MKLLFGEQALYTDTLTGYQHFGCVPAMLGSTWERGRGRKDLNMKCKREQGECYL